MASRRWFGLVGLASAAVLVSGCESPSSVFDANKGALAFQVTGQAGQDVTSGRVRVFGDANMVISGLTPGETRNVNLDPGTVGVAFEGLNGVELVAYAVRPGIVISAGRRTSVTATLTSFIPGAPTVAPAQVAVGEPLVVSWSAVTGANSYIVEWSTSSSFSSVAGSQSTSSTSTQVTFSTEGTFYFRVIAQNQFGTRGAPGDASSGASVQAQTTPPVVTDYQASFIPVSQGCSAGFRTFQTWYALTYTDSGGDFPTSTLTEGVDAEHEVRLQGQADWQSVPSGPWSADSGATGSSGGFTRDGSICFGLPMANMNDLYMDSRVRVRDTAGTWSDWREYRLMLPQTVEITEQGFQLSAVARDDNGDLVSGDPINWSSYNGPNLATISSDGLYTPTDPLNVTGVDRAYARAGFAFMQVGVSVPGADVDRYFAPGWLRVGLDGAMASWYYRRMTVYAGKEYTFELAPDVGAPSGDPDLFIRMGAKPTTTMFDDISGAFGIPESIDWTAPADGTLWIGVYGFSAFTDIMLSADADNNGYPVPDETLAPSAPPFLEVGTGDGGLMSNGPGGSYGEETSAPGPTVSTPAATEAPDGALEVDLAR